MFNAGVRGKRAKDGVGFLSTAEQFNQKSFLVPTVTSFSITDVSYVPLDNTAVDTAGGEIIVINGSGFASGATVQVGATTIGSVTFIDQNRLAFTAPALSSGSYTIYVTNSNGGTGILLSGLVYSGLPTYSTSAGSLGTIYETANINTAVVATGDAPITYSVISGTLPSGATLNSNGTITGNAPVDGSSTTYSFTIQATDAQLQDSTRAFTLTINTDVLTWGLANNTVYSLDGGTTMSNVTLSATSSANSNSAVTFAANTLPTGVSLSGNTIFGTPTTEQTVYSTLTATATQTGRTATRFVSWVVSVSDLFFKYNTLAIQGADTTFVDDASTNNFAVTINGDTKPNSFNPYTPGYYSNYFDGTGDYLNFANNNAFALGSGDFTMEAWVYCSSNANTQAIMGLASNTGNATTSAFVLYASNTNKPTLLMAFSASYTTLTGSQNLPTNAWTHIAAVRSGTTVTLYMNGTSIGSAAVSTSAFNASSASLAIGRTGDYNGEYLTGYISNARLVKGQALYTTTFTPSTTPLTTTSQGATASNVSLLTCQSNRFIDNSTNNFTITVAGNTTVNSFDPFIPNSSYSSYGSGYFDGTGDYLNVPSNSALNFGTGDFTVEAWVNLTGVVTDSFIISATGAGGFFFGWNNTVGGFGWGRNAIAWDYQPTGTTRLNQWQHVAVSRSGTSMRLFVNGSQVGTTQTNSTSYDMSLTSTTIGSQGTSYYWTGYITNLRAVKGTAVYTSNFTPPTAPLTAIANTSLLTLQNNQSVNNNVFLDNSTNNFLVTRAGNTTQGTFSPYGGNWSNYFGGNSALTISTPVANFLCTGSATGITATIEAWVYMTAYSTGGSAFLFSPIFAKGATYINFGVRNGAVRFYWFDGAGKTLDSTSTSDVPLNTWTHIAVTISGTTLKIYVNGTLNTTSATFTGVQSAGSGTVPYIAYEGSGTLFSGYISNFRLSTSVIYSSAFTPSSSPLTPSTNTQLLTCQSNRYIDNSTNNYTVTPSGTVFSIQRFSPFNPSSLTPTSYSGYFDGTGDYLNYTGGTTTTLSGDYTFECWVYLNNLSASQPMICIGDDFNLGLGFFITTSGKINLYGNAASIYTSTGSTVVVNTWTHIAVVRSGSTITGYINGVAQSTATNSSQYSGTTTYIGRETYNTGYATSFSGYLSNVRLVKGVAVYTGAFTVPTSPLQATQSSETNIAAITGTSTSLLTCQSTTFIDNSTNNFTITANGNSQPTIQNPFGYTSATTNGYTPSTIGGSGYFDGTGDTLNLASSTALLGAGNYTVEFWVNLPSAPTGGAYYTCFAYGASGSVLRCFILDSSGTKLGIWVGASNVLLIATTAMIGQWAHIAIVRSGSACTAYVNGVSIGTFTDSTNFNTGQLYIASQAAFSYLLGYISDFRIVVGTSIYNSNFVPPSAPLTAVQNTVLLTNMTGAGIYDAAMMNNLETVGDAKLSTAVSKFGGTSIGFDGTGDYLYIPSAPANQLGAGDYTIEFWIYGNSWSTLPVILEYGRTAAGATAGLEFYVSTTGGKLDIYGGASTATLLASYSSLSTTTWTHIALTRASTTTRLFINGTQSGSSATDSTNYNQTQILIGVFIGGANPLNGYIDDLRITKGYARYTANFTPPTSAFKIK